MKKSCAHSHRSAELPELTAKLRNQSHKVTGQREAILNILRQRRGPMSIKEVFSTLCKGGCNLATVYRSMHLLEGMGMVKRFEFGDGVARFELLPEGDDGHHHHLVCTRCSRIVEIEECFPHDLEQKIALNNGFAGVTHKLEFFGVCPRCQGEKSLSESG